MTKSKKSVIVMRHASYEQSSGNLTPTGIEHAKSAASKIAEADMIPDLIRYSPSIRAVQTARTLQDVFNDHTERKILSASADWLSPNGFPKINDILCHLKQARSIMLITHEPQANNISGQFRKYDVDLLPAEVIVFSFDSFDKGKNSPGNIQSRWIFQLPRGKKAAAPQTP